MLHLWKAVVQNSTYLSQLPLWHWVTWCLEFSITSLFMLWKRTRRARLSSFSGTPQESHEQVIANIVNSFSLLLMHPQIVSIINISYRFPYSLLSCMRPKTLKCLGISDLDLCLILSFLTYFCIYFSHFNSETDFEMGYGYSARINLFLVQNASYAAIFTVQWGCIFCISLVRWDSSSQGSAVYGSHRCQNHHHVESLGELSDRLSCRSYPRQPSWWTWAEVAHY